jgi:hypothetical protein
MQVLESLRTGRIAESWFRNLDILLQFTLETLEKKGHHELAVQASNEWRFYHGQIEMALKHDLPLTTFDLGDHRPLSAWLAWFYDEVETKLGRRFCAFFHIDDIKAFNYGYIVTMNPWGDPVTRETWDRLEYQRHFVPFATASFYWSSYLACNLSAPMPASLGCSVALQAPRYLVRRWIAPPLAMEVFERLSEAF